MTQSETLQTEETSEPAPDTGAALDENTAEQTGEGESTEVKETVDEPSGFTKRINQKHYELMEEKRGRQAAEQELAKFKANSADNQRPLIPDVPDPYDDDFSKKTEAREQAIVKATKFDFLQEVESRDEKIARQQGLDKQNAELDVAIKSYSGRAAKLNITPQALTVAGQTVAAFGMSDEIVGHILADEQGPLITTYLAQNPDELEKLATMAPMQAAVYLETTVKPKAGSAKPKSDLSPPADTLSGGGAPPSSKGPAGATYE